MKNQKLKELQFKRTYFLVGLNLVLILCLVTINWKSTIRASSLPKMGPLDYDTMLFIPPTDHKNSETSEDKPKIEDLFKDPVAGDPEPDPDPNPLIPKNKDKFSKLLVPKNKEGKKEIIIIEPVFNPDSIYNVDPEFTLGKFNEYLQRMVDMPQVAKDLGINGLVAIEFIVEPNGEIKVVRAIAPKHRQLGYGIEEACIKAIIGSSKLWVPAEVNGKPVRSRFRVPIEIDNSGW